MFLQTLEKAPGQITSAQVIKGRPTVLTTVPPPGWKWPERYEPSIHTTAPGSSSHLGVSSATELRQQVTQENAGLGNATDDEEDTRPLVEVTPTVELRDSRDRGDGNSGSVSTPSGYWGK